MIQKLSVPVSVDLFFDHKLRRSIPVRVTWENRDYLIIKIGLHHTYRQGRTLYHVFSAISQNIYFRLVFNTENLAWSLEEIADGESN